MKSLSVSFIQNSKLMEHCRDMAISDFEFRGTFKEMRVEVLGGPFRLLDILKGLQQRGEGVRVKREEKFLEEARARARHGRLEGL